MHPVAFQCAFLTLKRLHRSFEVFYHIRFCRKQNLNARRAGVQKINRLVRKLPSRNVASGQLRRRKNGIVPDVHTMCRFVFVLEAAQNQNGCLHIRFVQFDRLETPCQRSVFFKILFVFRPGRSGNGTQFPARQRRLQQIGGIASSCLIARTNECMRFVDKKNRRRR